MPANRHPERPRQSRAIADPFYDTGADVTAQWQSLVDAGGIGKSQPCDPEVAANRERTAALFARLARRHR